MSPDFPLYIFSTLVRVENDLFFLTVRAFRSVGGEGGEGRPNPNKRCNSFFSELTEYIVYKTGTPDPYLSFIRNSENLWVTSTV